MSLVEPLVETPIDRDFSVSMLTKKVLVLGNDDRVLLAVARGLGREGSGFARDDIEIRFAVSLDPTIQFRIRPMAR